MDGIVAGKQADPRPLRERIPTMAGTALAPELRQRGLKPEGRVDDMRARLLAWLDIEHAGKQKLRSEQQRRNDLKHLTIDDLRAEVQRRGLLAAVGKPFVAMKKDELVELLAAFHSTPQEFVLESDRLGWDRVPDEYVHSPLPPFPNRVGPRAPFDEHITELDAFLLLLRIPEKLRARFGGHADLIDLIVRVYCVACVCVCVCVRAAKPMLRSVGCGDKPVRDAARATIQRQDTPEKEASQQRLAARWPTDASRVTCVLWFVSHHGCCENPSPSRLLEFRSLPA